MEAEARSAEADLAGAFDPAPAVHAAAAWMERALRETALVRDRLSS